MSETSRLEFRRPLVKTKRNARSEFSKSSPLRVNADDTQVVSLRGNVERRTTRVRCVRSVDGRPKRRDLDRENERTRIYVISLDEIGRDTRSTRFSKRISFVDAAKKVTVAGHEFGTNKQRSYTH